MGRKNLWTSSAKSKQDVDAFAMQYHLERKGWWSTQLGGGERGDVRTQISC